MKPKLPAKSERPKDGKYHWSNRYFDVGEAVTGVSVHGTLDLRDVTISRITINRFNRISYYALVDGKEQFFLLEDLAPDRRGIHSTFSP